ncbi:MAG: nitroreductase family protein [Anaerolineales bacterium]
MSPIDLLRTRRSIRRYTDQPVPPSLVQSLLEAAIWAPSAHNRQPWRFAVIAQSATKDALARAMGARLRADLQADAVPEDVIQADVSRSYARLTGAPVLICLCLSMEDMDDYPDPVRQGHEWTMAVQSTAMAGQNLLLAAHDAGLGACWMCAPLFVPDILREVLNLPAVWHPQGLITLGYPAQERDKTRHPAEGITLWR